MRINSFLKLVEIRTKLASFIPLMLGTIYAIYHFHSFKAVNFMLMFGALLAIDMTTTALNNYFDFRRAVRKHGYNYESHNAIVEDNLSEKSVLAVITIMLLAGVVLGITLVMNTNIVVLLFGAASFGIGICYSFGPVPISRTPLGELLSGFFMGVIIVFLSIYIHIYDLSIISIKLDAYRVFFDMDILQAVYIILFSIPTFCGISNIMLANNICDVEDDIENRRYTLPVYLGKEKALWLFKALYYIAYADIAILLVLRVIPVLCLAVLLTFVPVNKNIKAFYAEQTKKATFVLSVKNFTMITVPLILLFALSLLLDLII